MTSSLDVTHAPLEAELADSRLLQAISAELITEDDERSLYEKILDAAMSIMRSDCASLQRFFEDAEGGCLKLIAYRNFDAPSAAFWETVYPTTRSACGEVLRTRGRVIISDVRDVAFMAGTNELASCMQAGMSAVQSTPLFSRAGRLVGVFSTQWQKPHVPTERDLRLLDILARQAADLIERKLAEERLRESDRRKEEFLATLAHELRNPLAPIRNAIQILQLIGPPDPDLRWAREVIVRQTNHLARLVDDLLDVSRINRDRLELHKEPVVLSQMLRSAIETTESLIAQRGHTLTVTGPADAVVLDGDPVRLTQIFGNLLNNAAKFSGPGGHITLSAERQTNEVVVRVRDHGIGIDASTLPHVFHLFGQSRQPLEREHGGLGVGLTLVKRLVEMHGGQVTAASDGIGLGAEFTVRLPVAPSAEAAPACVDASLSEARGPLRVLVVDDHRDGAASLCRLLQLLGYETRQASDGLSGFEVAAAFHPDVALLDIGMPKLNGYELAGRLRAEPWGKVMMLVAVTGWGHASDKRRAADAGFDHHLIKPASPAEVTRLLASFAVSKEQRV
jgi:signal transduction histidine kinase/CheY-like chemotaxis protein